MIHEYHDESIGSELKGESLELSTYLTTMTDESDIDFLFALATDLLSDKPEETGIKITFRLSSPLDYMLDGHACGNGNHDIDGKPLFDAMRAELVAMIARIDAVKFV